MTIPTLGFLINFRPTYLPPRDDTSKPGLFLTPDRVLHPSYAPRKRGRGLWVTCNRDAVERLHQPGAFLSLLPHLGKV